MRHSIGITLAVGGVASVVATAVPSSSPAGPEPAALAASAASFTLPENVEDAPAATVPAPREAPLVDVTALADVARTAVQKSGEATQRAEAERSAAEARAKAALAGETLRAPAAAASCGLSTSGLGAVKPWVTAAVRFLGCRFGQPQTLGVGSRGGASDHPSGLAADFMVNRATGDALAACALRNKAALGITYVIWQQRINYGSGWQMMEDRGSATANHRDHVHISFARSAPGGTPTC